MANDEEPIEKALMASSSAATTSKESVNSNLVTLMVDSGASAHYFDDAIIRDIKHRLQDYVHLTTRSISLPGELCWTAQQNALCKALSTTTTATKILVRIDIVVVLGIGRHLFSVMTAGKKRIIVIFDYETPGWRDST